MKMKVMVYKEMFNIYNDTTLANRYTDHEGMDVITQKKLECKIQHPIMSIVKKDKNNAFQYNNGDDGNQHENDEHIISKFEKNKDIIPIHFGCKNNKKYIN